MWQVDELRVGQTAGMDVVYIWNGERSNGIGCVDNKIAIELLNIEYCIIIPIRNELT